MQNNTSQGKAVDHLLLLQKTLEWLVYKNTDIQIARIRARRVGFWRVEGEPVFTEAEKVELARMWEEAGGKDE
ncbi:MAG: hypothetical protein HY916_09220 [Desulfovibrio sp.]|jgi:hypothetical protein|nr:hypothetical protein [Desulfovibrio sp.]